MGIVRKFREVLSLSFGSGQDIVSCFLFSSAPLEKCRDDPDTNSRPRVLSATLFPVYFHHSSFCPVAAEYMKAVGEKEKEFNDVINVEV